jgi:putative toxin-antitoxin system antitoxin component (TIGR02293 family)
MTLSGSAATVQDDPEAGYGNAGRIAAILNLPRPEKVTDLALDAAINKGLSLKSYESLLNSIRDPKSDWSPPIVSAAAFQRAKRERNRLKPAASGQVYEFARVVDSARQVLGKNVDGLRRFFSTPNALLDGRKPIDVILSSPAGADAVHRILNEARAGVAV